MSLPTLYELKSHLNLTEDESEFDSELPRHLSAATEKVMAYINRSVYLTEADIPVEPEPGYIIVNESINRAILEIAGYYFDAKGSVDSEMTANMLDAFVGHLRLSSFT